ncbi:hypothetical protein HS088_TW02G00508 [Tripterygium wilfordii]|uniref:Exocyst subunit Exo70 family protein n=1 Tax=Tripterygium wilfordii TaxID=458696 RepID=A0A7J7DZ76_TRIWF|nr:hypothetical protein HS088_TW02G00508 [Tripterygium wilfordii]
MCGESPNSVADTLANQGTKQSSWVIPDSKLRDEIKVSVAKKLLPAYREFYAMHRMVIRRAVGSEELVRFAPDDLGNHLSELFYVAAVEPVYWKILNGRPNKSKKNMRECKEQRTLCDAVGLLCKVQVTLFFNLLADGIHGNMPNMTCVLRCV